MASRPIWRGHLRLALVSCPVAMFNARHDRSSIKFNMINPETGNRIKMVTQDSVTGEELQRGKLSKGYEYTKNKFVIFSDEDLDSVKVDTSAIMTVEKFVDAGSIDPVYYDSSYYLAPDGKAGEDVYAVLKEAIAQTGMVALTRVVISQRERVVALRPMGGGLMAHTLNEGRDLNSADQYFEAAAELKPEAEMVDLAIQLIKRQSASYDPADFEDRYETRLRAMIDAKVAGREFDPEEEEPADRGNVIDLVAALRRSLGEPVMRNPPETTQGLARELPTENVKPARKRAQESAKHVELRNQQSLKLPIKGGLAEATEQGGSAKPKEAGKKGSKSSRPSTTTAVPKAPRKRA